MLQGVASHGGGAHILNFNGGNETPRDVIASFEGGAKAVGGDPRGAAVLRVLRGAGALQDFPTLLREKGSFIRNAKLCAAGS